MYPRQSDLAARLGSLRRDIHRSVLEAPTFRTRNRSPTGLVLFERADAYIENVQTPLLLSRMQSGDSDRGLDC